MVDIRSRVHRILKNMPRFRELLPRSDLSSLVAAGLTLRASEEAVGIYTNDDVSSFSEAILFTTEGLYLHKDERWLPILYSDIARTVPPSSKREVTGFNVLLRNGTEIRLPVIGSKDGRFYDAFEVLRFVDRVKEDVAST
jgi:hypothetical protein